MLRKQLESKDKPIPNLEFSTKVEMNSGDFAEAVEDCSIVADSCGFDADPDKFSIFAKGPLNSANLTYSSDEIRIESPIESKSRYSLEYLQKMIKATKITEKVNLNFSSDYPLRMEFIAPMVTLAFILALGGSGMISASANVVPGLFVSLYNRTKKGEWEKAFELQKKFYPLKNALFKETNPAPIKFALSYMGFCENELRLPLVSVKPDTEEVVKNALKQLEDVK